MTNEIKQVYFPYWLWEEYHAGMWRNVGGQERQDLLKKAIEFTGDNIIYGKWMVEVIKRWPNSCLHTFTNSSMNHQAWIGHAAACLAIGSPEDITRLAWHELTQEQQDKANARADTAIALWHKQYEKGIQLCQKLI